MKEDKIKIGAEAENQAAEYLVSKGFEIKARNYRHKKSEIDLIIQKDDWLIFVEVRKRTNLAFGYPEESISANKRNKIMEGANHYLEETQWQGNVRYDIIAIDGKEIVHFEDAFY